MISSVLWLKVLQIADTRMGTNAWRNWTKNKNCQVCVGSRCALKTAFVRTKRDKNKNASAAAASRVDVHDVHVCMSFKTASKVPLHPTELVPGESSSVRTSETEHEIQYCNRTLFRFGVSEG
jgi:hypothetical protein